MASIEVKSGPAYVKQSMIKICFRTFVTQLINFITSRMLESKSILEHMNENAAFRLARLRG